MYIHCRAYGIPEAGVSLVLLLGESQYFLVCIYLNYNKIIQQVFI